MGQTRAVLGAGLTITFPTHFFTSGVSDPTYAATIALLGERGLVDLIGLLGYYSCVAIALNVDRCLPPDGARPALKPLR
jgi:4-carboxymuconolactone decarboxylase